MPLTILPVSRHKNRSKCIRFYCILTLIIPIFPNFLTKYSYPILRITACFTTPSAKTLVLFSYPPCLILRKFARRGPSVLKRKYCRDLNSHSPFFSTSYHILYKSSIFFLFSITVFFKELISSSYFCMSCSSILAKSILIFNCKSSFASIRACRFPD